MLELPLSTYYLDLQKTRAQKEEEDADIKGKFEQVRVDFFLTEYRTLLHYLKRVGIIIGETKLRRVLVKFKLQIISKKRYMVTTDSNHDCLVYPNPIKEMTIDDVSRVWASDITYIRINNGFVYLAVILDLYSSKVIEFAVSKKIDSALVIDALNMAILRRHPPKGVIHPSDRGVQFNFASIGKFQNYHYKDKKLDKNLNVLKLNSNTLH